MKCAFVSVCEEIVLDDSGKSQKYDISSNIYAYSVLSVVLKNMLQYCTILCNIQTYSHDHWKF